MKLLLVDAKEDTKKTLARALSEKIPAAEIISADSGGFENGAGDVNFSLVFVCGAKPAGAVKKIRKQFPLAKIYLFLPARKTLKKKKRRKNSELKGAYFFLKGLPKLKI